MRGHLRIATRHDEHRAQRDGAGATTQPIEPDEVGGEGDVPVHIGHGAHADALAAATNAFSQSLVRGVRHMREVDDVAFTVVAVKPRRRSHDRLARCGAGPNRDVRELHLGMYRGALAFDSIRPLSPRAFVPPPTCASIDSMPRLRTRRGLLLAITCLFASSDAAADETHYQSVFVGDRAFGMGGASTGLADDTSTTYYNPAGLAELPNRSFSASLGLTAFERTRIRDGVRGPDSVADLTQSGSRSLPVFSAAVLRFGPRGEDGLKRHAMAFSTHFPASVDLSLRVDLLHPDTSIPSSVRVDHAFRQTLYGLSYAVHTSRKVAFGVTLFLATQRLSHRETLFIANGGVLTPDGGFDDVESHVALTTIAGRSFSFLPRFGVFYRPTEKLSFGLTLQPPTMPFYTRASLSQQSTTAVVDDVSGRTTSYFDVVDQRGMTVRMPIPWMVRVGVGYRIDDAWTLAFDASLHGGIRARRVLPGADENALTQAPFMPVSTRRLPTVDAAVGVEWLMREEVTWRVGVFTNRSAAPRVPEAGTTYQLARVHHYGGSFALGVNVGPLDLMVGLAGSRGHGRGLSVDADPLSSSLYGRTRVEERVVHLYVSGAMRSVARLAQRAVERVRTRDERRAADDVEGDDPDAP